MGSKLAWSEITEELTVVRVVWKDLGHPTYHVLLDGWWFEVRSDEGYERKQIHRFDDQISELEIVAKPIVG